MVKSCVPSPIGPVSLLPALQRVAKSLRVCCSRVGVLFVAMGLAGAALSVWALTSQSRRPRLGGLA
jgi:hypothetical protein